MDRAPFTAALKERLLDVTGRPGDVGRSPKPEDGETAPEAPWWVLHPVPGGALNGPPARPEADATLVYQLTCVGRRADQIEALADRARAGLLERGPDGTYVAVVAAGITVMDVRVESLGGVDFEGDVGNLAELYAFDVTTS